MRFPSAASGLCLILPPVIAMLIQNFKCDAQYSGSAQIVVKSVNGYPSPPFSSRALVWCPCVTPGNDRPAAALYPSHIARDCWQSIGGSGLETSTSTAAIWILALAIFALLVAAGFY